MDPEIQEVPLSRPDVVVIDDNPHLSSPPPPHPNAPSSAPVPPAATTNTTNNAASSNATNPLASNLQPASSRTDPLENLEKALESASETLSSLATSVIHFSYDSQNIVFSKVNDFVKDLRKIDSVSQDVNADIPFEIIETIDKGRNPEQCTYQMLYVNVLLRATTVQRMCPLDVYHAGEKALTLVIVRMLQILAFCLSAMGASFVRMCRESCAEANNNARGKLAVIRGLRSAMEAASTDADGKSGGQDGGVSVGNVVTNGF